MTINPKSETVLALVGLVNAHTTSRLAFGKYNVIVKSFPSHKAYRAALISVSLALRLPDTSLHCQNTDMRDSASRGVPVMPQLLLVVIAPTHRGMARLS